MRRHAALVSRVSSVPSAGRTRLVEGRLYVGSTPTGPTFRLQYVSGSPAISDWPEKHS